MKSVFPTGLESPSALLLAAAPAVFVVLWATGFIGARLGIPHAEPFTFLLLRLVLAAALLLGIALVTRAPWPKGGRAVAASVFAGSLIHGVYLGGVFWAISRGMPAGVAALIVALQPLITAILAGQLLGERVSRSHWAGLGVGLFGVALVLAPRLELAGFGITPATVGAIVISVFAIALGSISQKAFCGDADLRTGTFLQNLGGALVVGIGATVSETFHIEWAPAFIFALGWLVLVMSLALALFMLLIRRGAVARVATLFYLVPPVTALMAWILFDETMTWVQLAGMGVTAAGVALATRVGPR